jgi:hypothetical protein
MVHPYAALTPSQFVNKRDGRQERVAFDKITSRINKLCYGLDMQYVDPAKIAQKVVSGVYQGVTTVELDNLAAETSAYLTVSPGYLMQSRPNIPIMPYSQPGLQSLISTRRRKRSFPRSRLISTRISIQRRASPRP